MRLKTSMDGPLSAHNGNHNVLNSPKRLNTIQNSNVTSNNYISKQSEDILDNDQLITLSWTGNQKYTHNNINSGTDLQWCNEEATNDNTAQKQIRQPRSFNINNGTLAVSLSNSKRKPRDGSAESPVSSSEDSILEFEEAGSASSVDASPQNEERAFDLSDSDDSDDGNLNLTRGIVNPNYPGFQHLAHTLDLDLDFPTKCEQYSDDEYTDGADHNANENNNNQQDLDTGNVENDKIDSVNRLDSVDNIQKVFYEKSVFNITCDGTSDPSNTEETHTQAVSEQVLTACDVKESISCGNIVGNFGEEIEQELGRIASDHTLPLNYQIKSAVERELELACEKLTIADLQPAATKYQIEPNTEQPFLFAAAVIHEKPILQEAITVKNTDVNDTNTYCNMRRSSCYLQGDEEIMKAKLSDAFLSNAKDKLSDCGMNIAMEVEDGAKNFDSNRLDSPKIMTGEAKQEKAMVEPKMPIKGNDVEKFCKEDQTKNEKEKDEDSAVPRKKEKTETYTKKRRDYNQQIGSLITIPRREFTGRGRDNLNRRSLPISSRDKKRASTETFGGFDVYNIETAMPKIDMDVIESHLRAAREEERRRRTDREEIRRRLAMGNEDDYYNGCDRPCRKPSLQARLQSGMNLQICFMNETASDTESPSSDSECTPGKPKQAKTISQEKSLPIVRPATLSLGVQQPQSLLATMNEADFFTKQARLQTEARMALAQAKEMARMQMEIERQRQKKSPITEMVRHSMEKVGIPFPEDRRRLSRQILTEMNVAQLQVIVNDLHTQIEILNDSLVKFLMQRDDLHMEQDSMLVDIEDLTRFLGAKEQIIKELNLAGPTNNNASPPSPAPASPLSTMNSVKPHFNRIASLVKK